MKNGRCKHGTNYVRGNAQREDMLSLVIDESIDLDEKNAAIV